MVRLGVDLQKYPCQYQWFLLHMELWCWQFSQVSLVASQWRTGCVRCRVALAQSQSHRPCSAMHQLEFMKYQQMHFLPPHCVNLLESKRSEDTSREYMSGLTNDYPLSVVVLVTKCQHKQLCLTYEVELSCPLQGRWCPLAFVYRGYLARQCDDISSGLDSQGCNPISLSSIRIKLTRGQMFFPNVDKSTLLLQ